MLDEALIELMKNGNASIAFEILWKKSNIPMSMKFFISIYFMNHGTRQKSIRYHIEFQIEIIVVLENLKKINDKCILCSYWKFDPKIM